MSIKWMATVWEDAIDVEGTELLVLLSIADHAGDDGKAWPSVDRLARRARRAISTVQAALSNLETRGWLEREFRNGQTTMYRLRVPRSQQTTNSRTPPVDQTPPVSGPPQSAGGEGSSGPDQGGPVGRTQNHKRTTNEPGGVVEEVTTDATPADPVTERPFPGWARAALGSVTEQQAGEWVTAWRSVTETAQEWDPGQNLTKYLARCKERKKVPSPDEWVRWFAEDDLKAQREARAVAASTNQETPPQWWE